MLLTKLKSWKYVERIPISFSFFLMNSNVLRITIDFFSSNDFKQIAEYRKEKKKREEIQFGFIAKPIQYEKLMNFQRFE